MRSRYDLIYLLSSILIFIVLETLSIVMVANNSVVQRFKILGAIRDAETFFWEKGNRIHAYSNYKFDNERLINENLQLHAELDRYRTFLADKDSIATDSEGQYVFRAAHIVRNSINKQHNYLILDRGAENGVEVGMGVITNNGVVGIVNATTRRHCCVTSLLNKGQSVSAKLASGASFGPLSWNGKNSSGAVLSEISIHSGAAVGDTIVTSGYSTIYPPGIPIGRVVGTRIIQGVTLDLDVELFEDFRSLNNVYIVSNTREKEIHELYE